MRADDAGPRHLPPRTDARHTGSLMTADRFAATIGLSSRTIRSYHARGLLPPPDRVGRTPCYTDRHLARMRQVIDFQSRGLPLEAVRALLEPDLVLSEIAGLGPAVSSAVRRQPGLLAALAESGVLIRHADGGIGLTGVRAVLAARAVSGQGASIDQALAFLATATQEVMPDAEEVLAKVLGVAEEWLPRTGLARGSVAELAVEVIRTCILRAAHAQPIG